MTHPRYYWTADRSAIVDEDDPRAASLAYAEADEVTPEHLALLAGAAPEPAADMTDQAVPRETETAAKPRATRKPKA